MESPVTGTSLSVHAPDDTAPLEGNPDSLASPLPEPAPVAEDPPAVFGNGSAGEAQYGDAMRDTRLPLVGAVFSCCVLLLGAWDHAAHATQDYASTLLRLALVILGMGGYAWAGLGWTALPRWILLYLTHSLALMTNAGGQVHGLTQAMPVLVVALVATGLIETRRRRCLALVLTAALPYLGIGALVLAPPAWLASVAVLALATVLTLLVATAQASQRRARQRHEEQLLVACRFDSLSGAMSRAYLGERAARDFSLAQRHARPLAVAMLDLDHFKNVNDTHGHATGDAVIRGLVATCKAILRHEDYVGRIGGEEFVCVMPETSASEALACAQRIRMNFERLRLNCRTGQVHATVSIGIAVMGQQETWEALLAEADAAMYRAKNTGRNRCVVADRSAARGDG
jgi:diguanylate cyclase (GGDEF)-like protein